MQDHHTKRAKSREKAEDFFAIGDPCKTDTARPGWRREVKMSVSLQQLSRSCVDTNPLVSSEAGNLLFRSCFFLLVSATEMNH